MTADESPSEVRAQLVGGEPAPTGIACSDEELGYSESPPPSTEIVLPTSGELISLEDPEQCARALTDLRQLRQDIDHVVREVSDALVAHSRQIGKKTILLPGGRQAIIRGGRQTVYDAEALESGLRQAGMPEERISEIVVPVVSYRVKAVEAKRAAAANPNYAEVIEQHSSVVEKSTSVEIK